MHLVLVDSVVAKEREEELVHILEKIFCERCGFDLIVETEMRKPEGESRAMRNSELRIREEVRHVLAHTHYGEMLGEKEQNRMEEQAEAAGEQPKAAAAAKGGEAKKEKAADGGRGKFFRRRTRFLQERQGQFQPECGQSAAQILQSGCAVRKRFRG